MKKSRSIKKPGINIDMTPLVDVIMLLLTFFMLTATFKAAESEAVEVSLPKSINTDSTRLPDTDIMIITLTPQGDVFLDVDNYKVREVVYGDPFAIGMYHPDSTTTSEVVTTGKVGNKEFKRNIKVMTREQFEKSMLEMRAALMNMTEGKQDFRIVVKGDKDTDFGVVQDLMSSLKETNNTRFALVTDLKSETIQ